MPHLLAVPIYTLCNAATISLSHYIHQNGVLRYHLTHERNTASIHFKMKLKSETELTVKSAQDGTSFQFYAAVSKGLF
jgi:hypothetical protein